MEDSVPQKIGEGYAHKEETCTYSQCDSLLVFQQSRVFRITARHLLFNFLS